MAANDKIRRASRNAPLQCEVYGSKFVVLSFQCIFILMTEKENWTHSVDAHAHGQLHALCKCCLCIRWNVHRGSVTDRDNKARFKWIARTNVELFSSRHKHSLSYTHNAHQQCTMQSLSLSVRFLIFFYCSSFFGHSFFWSFTFFILLFFFGLHMHL